MRTGSSVRLTILTGPVYAAARGFSVSTGVAPEPRVSETTPILFDPA